MSSATTTLVSEQWLVSSGPALVWTRSGGGANIVVLTDDQIAVGVLPPAQLKTAQERLDNGEALINVVGPKAAYIHLGAIETVDAALDGAVVRIQHCNRGSRQKQEQLRFADRDAQADFVVELRQRLPQSTEAFKTATNRWTHALKPLNLLAISLLATIGVHTLFALELTDRHATRAKLDRWAAESGPADNSLEARAVRRGTQKATAHAIAANPAVARILVFGVIIIGIIGLILGSLGYIASMSLFGGASVACMVWAINRLADPPQSILLVVPSRR